LLTFPLLNRDSHPDDQVKHPVNNNFVVVNLNKDVIEGQNKPWNRDKDTVGIEETFPSVVDGKFFTKVFIDLGDFFISQFRAFSDKIFKTAKRDRHLFPFDPFIINFVNSSLGVHTEILFYQFFSFEYF
jgi:hypothetical protein